MNREKKKKIALLVILVLLWAYLVWFSLGCDADAQYCHLSWRRYFSYWYQRWVAYPVWCCGYSCVPACQNYYGGWGPCDYTMGR